MSSIRLDDVVFSSLHEVYQNYATLTGTIVIPVASIASGGLVSYSVVIPYNRAGTRADIYASGATTTSTSVRKVSITSGGRVAGSIIDDALGLLSNEFNVVYTPTTITVSAVLYNSQDFSVDSVAQHIAVSVVQYDAPITSI